MTRMNPMRLALSCVTSPLQGTVEISLKDGEYAGFPPRLFEAQSSKFQLAEREGILEAKKE